MPDLIVENETFLLDVDGFLKEPDRWSGPVAEALAKSSGIDELTDEHWNLINFIRDYWLKYGVAPTIRTFCRETGYAIEKIYDNADELTKIKEDSAFIDVVESYGRSFADTSARAVQVIGIWDLLPGIMQGMLKEKGESYLIIVPEKGLKELLELRK